MTAAWMARANCAGVDPALFFPEEHASAHAIDAKQVCAGCAVRVECLEFALEHNERWGVWGGMGRRERLEVQRRRTA